MSNGGYNPLLFEPKKTSMNQMKSQQPPHQFGGSQIMTGLGFRAPIRTKIPKPSKIRMK